MWTAEGEREREGSARDRGLKRQEDSPSLPGGFFIVQKPFTVHPEHWAGKSALLEPSSGTDRQQTEK